jgi:hypothetical protein
MSYPQYAASLFAGNDFFRSLFAFGAVLFSRPMYVYLGVGKGISVLGGLAVVGIVSDTTPRNWSETVSDLRLDWYVCTMALRCEIKGEIEVRGMM